MSRGSSENPTGWGVHALSALLLLAGATAIYSRVSGFGYAGIDDQGYVIYTEAVRRGLTPEGIVWAFTEFHMSNWHPLTWISYMLDVTLFGLHPGPQHIVNVVIHGANSLLVYLLALRMLRRWFASLVVAWLFMAHPLHVESVAWIAERKDVLCGFFFLCSLLAYLRYAAMRSVGRYLWVALAFALALLSKPMAVTLPLVLLLLDYWPLARFGGADTRGPGGGWSAFVRMVAEKAPLFLLSLGSGVITLMAQTKSMAPVEHVSVGYRLMNVVLSWAVYLRDLVLPTKLAVLYPLFPIDFATQFLPALAIVTTISALALLWRKRFPWILFGWLWFVLTLLPVIGLIQVGSQSHADRYMYLPSLGPFLAVGALLARITAARLRLAMLGALPLLVFYATIAWVQVGYWSGPYMLFTRVIDVVGENLQSHISLSVYFLNEGQLDQSEFHALRALELDSDSAIAYANLGSVRMLRKDFVAAEKLFQAALAKAPGDAQILNNLGISVEEQGRLDEARHYFEAALARDPNLYKVRANLERVGGGG